jgi:hypothetical protein
MNSITNVLEVYVAAIFRIEVCRVGEFMCTKIGLKLQGEIKGLVTVWSIRDSEHRKVVKGKRRPLSTWCKHTKAHLTSTVKNQKSMDIYCI